jgi:hypothetical protein
MMDHAEAARMFAVERYVLGDLGEAQRDEFEDHFFGCTECAEDLRATMTLIAIVKAVFREPKALEGRATVPKRIQRLPFAG